MSLSVFSKSFAFGTLLLLFYARDFNFFWFAALIMTASFLYFRPSLNNWLYLGSFISLLSLAAVAGNFMPQNWLVILAPIFFSFLFYLLLGVKNLIFIHRKNWYYLLSSALFYALFMAFFLSSKAEFFIFKLGGLLLILLILLGEFLKIFITAYPKRRVLVCWALSLLVIELIWAVSFLPLGFLNSANLTLLSLLFLVSLTTHHFNGTLKRKVVLSNTAIFVLLSLLIFATSRFSIL